MHLGTLDLSVVAIYAIGASLIAALTLIIVPNASRSVRDVVVGSAQFQLFH
ncbi:MAG: hypothetical protein K0U72_03985 [Gammaproteobacteria bacterium]|nr:hypothetical protein [Gammaproteobacteria bacterium]